MLGARTVAAVTAAAAVLGLAGACSSDDGSVEAFCQEVVEVPTLESVVTGFADVDEAALEHRLELASTAYRDLRRAAPGDIDDDVDRVVDLVDAVLDAVAEHGTDPEAVADRLRDVVDDHAGAEAAAARVVAYAAERCDVALDPAGDPVATTDDAGGG